MTRKKKIVSNPTIYVQIAAYRDPELLNTLRDCLTNAKYPENLRFGIAWQHSPYEEWDNLDEFKDDSRFHIIDIDYRDAKGPCWARHQLNNAYNGETYTLQLDSHHRFTLGWDISLISMLESLRTKVCPKPLLSSYLPSFDPKNDPESRLLAPWIMEFDRFAPESPVHFLPHTVDDYLERSRPIPTRFMSGHFIFADGIFCREVPYDPEYYFHGEEINLSVRSYMAGYDLFAPHRTYIWHEYTRDGKKKHWDDHSDWAILDKKSHSHNQEMFGIDKESAKISTNVRSLKDYEIYAGLEFSTRRVHKNTLAKKIPPVSQTEQEHIEGLTNNHKMCIDIYRPTFTEPAEDYVFWAVAFKTADDKEIYREDAGPEEIKRLLQVPVEQDKFIHIWRSFNNKERPTKWIVWPKSEKNGFLPPIQGEFGR